MKAFITAQLKQDAIDYLRARMEIGLGGWGHTGKKLIPEELVKAAAGCEVMVICYEEINDYVLDNLPELKLIACTRGGVENIDKEAVRRHSVWVTNAPGRNANAVADLTMGLMLCATRHISQTHHFIMNREWQRVPWDIAGDTPKKTFSGFELENKTLGMIGLGAIGRIVAKRAAGFGMRVISYDPYVKAGAAEGVQLVSLNDLLNESDVVSLHCKVTEQTRNIICERTLSMMKKSAVLVNTARGALVNESDLYNALSSHAIGCAALDVQIHEPMQHDSPLLELDNIILTPHIGGASDDIIEHQTRIVMEDIIAYLNEGRPVHVIS